MVSVRHRADGRSRFLTFAFTGDALPPPRAPPRPPFPVLIYNVVGCSHGERDFREATEKFTRVSSVAPELHIARCYMLILPQDSP